MKDLTASQGVCYGAPMEDITDAPKGITRGAPSATNGRHPDPEFEVMLVTPAQAKEWVDNHNTHNRPVKWKSVKQYAGAMRRGEWKLNGDAIRFDYNGVLIDGQNRLHAIVDADTPITSLVVTGLEPEAQNTMDMGARRSLADALALMKESQTSRLAGVIRWGYIYDRHLNTDAPMDSRFEAPTLQQLLAYFEANRSKIVVAVREGEKVYDKFRAISPTAAATAWFLFHELGWEDCQDFFYKLSLGASLEEDNPIFALRRWLLNNQELKHRRARPELVLAVIIKAWNFYRDGKRVELLRFVGGGSAPEKFPVAR